MKYLSDIPRTAMDVFNMLPEGTLCEVMDNNLYMSPAATPQHQEILGELHFEIKQFLKHQQQGKCSLLPVMCI